MLEVRDREEHGLKLRGERNSKVKFVLRVWGWRGVKDDVGELADKERGESPTI